MNKTQQNHVIKRLKTIIKTKVKSLEEELMTEYRGGIKTLTCSELIKGIKDDSIKMMKGAKNEEINRYTDIDEVFNVEKFLITDIDDLPKLEKKVNAYRDKLNNERYRIEDEMILGDADDAVKLIAAFEKFK